LRALEEQLWICKQRKTTMQTTQDNINVAAYVPRPPAFSRLAQPGETPEGLIEQLEEQFQQEETWRPEQPETVAFETLQDICSKLATTGFTPLVAALLKIEQDAGHSMSEDLKDRPHPFKESCLQVLCSMDERLIPHITSGNLWKASSNDPEIKQVLEDNYKRGQGHPAIYLRMVVTRDHGLSMTVADANRIIRYMLRYISEGEEAKECTEACFRIDCCRDETWSLVQTKQGDRRFLETKEKSRSDARVKVIRTFVHAMHARLRGLVGDERLEPPIQYCGYSSHVDVREMQHQSYGSSSSWLASFFMSVADAALGEKYVMKQAVVCLIGEERHGSIGEMVITRLSRAYYYTGGGFSIGLAGSSLRSIYMSNLSAQERATQWKIHHKYMMENTSYEDNMAQEMKRIIAFRKTQREEKKKALMTKIDGHKSRIAAHTKLVTEMHTQLQETADHPVWQNRPELKKRIEARYFKLEEINRVAEDYPRRSSEN
jgi:hypothetical protein